MKRAGVAKLVYAADLDSAGGNAVGVQIPSPARPIGSIAAANP
jgi:hypothetical protein